VDAHQHLLPRITCISREGSELHALDERWRPGSGVVVAQPPRCARDRDEAKAQGDAIVSTPMANGFARHRYAPRPLLRPGRPHGGRFNLGSVHGIGFARMNSRDYLMRIAPTQSPETALTEVYVPPEAATNPRHRHGTTRSVDPLSTGTSRSFDRRKCKVRSGPEAATASSAPKAGRLPDDRPQFKGLDLGSANHAITSGHRYNTSPPPTCRSADQRQRIADAWSTQDHRLRVPYPALFTRTSTGHRQSAAGLERPPIGPVGTRTKLPQRSGHGQQAQVYKLQLRPIRSRGNLTCREDSRDPVLARSSDHERRRDS